VESKHPREPMSTGPMAAKLMPSHHIVEFAAAWMNTGPSAERIPPMMVSAFFIVFG